MPIFGVLQILFSDQDHDGKIASFMVYDIVVIYCLKVHIFPSLMSGSNGAVWTEKTSKTKRKVQN